MDETLPYLLMKVDRLVFNPTGFTTRLMFPTLAHVNARTRTSVNIKEPIAMVEARKNKQDSPIHRGYVMHVPLRRIRKHGSMVVDYLRKMRYILHYGRHAQTGLRPASVARQRQRRRCKSRGVDICELEYNVVSL